MSVFTSAEIEYLRSQRLGRLAAVNGEGEPRAQAEHASRDDDGRGAGPEGREEEHGEQHGQETREDGSSKADAVGEATGERCEDG